MNAVQIAALDLLMDLEEQDSIEKGIEGIKLALLGHDPDRWARNLYDIPTSEPVRSVEEFMDDDGQINFENQTIVYERIPTAEEAEEKLMELLGNKSMTVGPPSKQFWSTSAG